MVVQVPELDVKHFRKTQDELPSEDSTSVEAPIRPVAFDSPIDNNELHGEVLSPQQQLVTTPIATPLAPILKNITPLQRVPFDKIESRAQLMAELNGILPLNEYNLPKYFYRADLLDFQRLAELHRSAALSSTNDPSAQSAVVDQETLDSILDAATIHLDYHHGYPTLRGGMPFWTQLGYESAEAFGAFAAYIEQPGARTFIGMSAYSPDLLAEWFHIYCWVHRAKAYDMFRITHHTRMRVHRIMNTEDNHYLESVKIFQKLVNAFHGKTAEDLQAMEPHFIVNSLEKIAKLQRISAGLPSAGAPESAKVDQPLSIEMQMRQIAKTDGDQHQATDEEADSFALLSNPDALQSAQELIVKIGISK